MNIKRYKKVYAPYISKTKWLIVGGLGLVIGFLGSCQKAADEFTPSVIQITTFRGADLRPDSALWYTEPSDTSSIEQSFQELLARPTSLPEEFTVNPGVGGTFVTSNGVRVTLLPNAVAASSNVKLSVRAILRRGDMVRTSITTAQDSNALTTGGMIWVGISQNNRPLSLQPGSALRIQLPAYNNAPTPDMELLRGQELGFRSFNWQSVSRQDSFNRVAIGAWREISQGQSTIINGYELTVNSLGWWSVGFQVPLPIRSKICVGLDSTFHPQNAAVFVVLRNFNTVMRLRPVFKDRNWCLPNAPVGFPATIVVLGRRDGEPYLGYSDLILLPNGEYAPRLARSTRASIESFLNSF